VKTLPVTWPFSVIGELLPAFVQQLLSLEAPLFPLSSRPERSAVERSLCGYWFLEMFFRQSGPGFPTPAKHSPSFAMKADRIKRT
jgi:hypothetical protein